MSRPSRSPDLAMLGLPIPRQEMPGSLSLPRHRHAEPYATVVLTGGYLEAGEAGRRTLRPGDVAVHASFSAHMNRVGRTGAGVLNIPIAGVAGIGESFGTLDDPDAVVRVAAHDAADAAALMRSMLRPARSQFLDWPDELARDLVACPTLPLAEWATSRGLATETLSRGFFRAFGVTPKRFRYESRARRALHAVAGGVGPLALIALDHGFCDQAQMTSAVADISGWPPRRWRPRSIGDKTEN